MPNIENMTAEQQDQIIGYAKHVQKVSRGQGINVITPN